MEGLTGQQRVMINAINNMEFRDERDVRLFCQHLMDVMVEHWKELLSQGKAE